MGIGLEVWFGYMIWLPGLSLFLRYVRSLVPLLQIVYIRSMLIRGQHFVLLSRLVDSFVGGALLSIRTVAVSFDGIGGRILSPGISAIQLILLVGQMRNFGRFLRGAMACSVCVTSRPLPPIKKGVYLPHSCSSLVQ